MKVPVHPYVIHHDHHVFFSIDVFMGQVSKLQRGQRINTMSQKRWKISTTALKVCLEGCKSCQLFFCRRSGNLLVASWQRRKLPWHPQTNVTKAMIVSEASFQISKNCQIFCDQHVIFVQVSPYRNFLFKKITKQRFTQTSHQIQKNIHHIFTSFPESKVSFRTLRTQLFGVVRHAERADGVFAWWEGGRWSSSEDGRRPWRKNESIDFFNRFHMGGSKNRGNFPPKWMVKIMENPIYLNGWFGGKTPLFSDISISDLYFVYRTLIWWSVWIYVIYSIYIYT